MNKRFHKVYFKLYFSYSENSTVLYTESEQLVQESLEKFRH